MRLAELIAASARVAATRVKRYREDKTPAQADTIATVRRLYESQLHRGGARAG